MTRAAAGLALRAAAVPAWLVLLVFAGAGARAQSPDLGSDAQRANGKALYDKFCSQCHGIEGDGLGPAAPALKPRPRDFTAGKFKIRSTASGALPTHDDLREIIRRGMPYTSMPGWPQFSDAELDDLTYYIKTFSEDFANPEYVPEAQVFPEPPSFTAESAELGRDVYKQLGCAKCHGEGGRGNGPSAPTLRDDWGFHIRPADLTAKWTFRGGATRSDLFRTFSTGLNGTPMPSYRDAVSDEQRWNLVDYVYALAEGEEAPHASMVVAKPVDGEIDLAETSELFDGAPVAVFPLVGQIVEPGRNFHPMVTDVKVQAVHGREAVAFRVRWNDLLADTAGHNGPALEAPRFDFAAQAAPSTAAEDEGDEYDPWGDEAEEEDEGDVWGDDALGEGEEDDFWDEEEDEAPSAVPASEFSDAVAVQFPMQLPTGIQKPYFLFGDGGNPVDLWFVDLAQAEVARRFTGRGSASIVESESSDVEVTGSYDDGEWSVVFKRPLRATEGITFAEGQFVPLALAVWDGFNEERGNKRSLTSWYYVYFEPREQPSVAGPVTRAALGVLALELLVIGWLRWRKRRGRPAAAPDGAQETA